jgi:hypothetical protein
MRPRRALSVVARRRGRYGLRPISRKGYQLRLPRLIVFGLVAALLVGVIGVGVAAGAKLKVRTKATISFQGSTYGDSFSGKVKAKGQPKKIKKKCKKGRNVILIRKQGNQKEKIGKVKSKKKGAYAFDVGVADSGNYFVKVKKKVKKKGDDKIVCRKGKSPTITVP